MKRLSAALDSVAGSQSSSIASGVSDIVVAGLGGTLGGVLMLQDEARPSDAEVLAATVVLAYSGMLLAAGSYELFAGPGRLRLRADELHALMARGPLDQLTIMRFEWSLQEAALNSRQARTYSGVAALGGALGGVAVLVLTAVSKLPSDKGKVLGYVEGGAMVGLGGVYALTSFFGESEAESQWRSYDAEFGNGARQAAITLGIDATSTNRKKAR